MSDYQLLPATDASTLDSRFIWNGRECAGNELHEAVLANDLEVTEKILLGTDLVRSRFHYETKTPQGKVQDGSGEAIHLASSRNLIEVTKLLLQHKADINAMVTRADQQLYDVIHCAVFSEGRGGSVEMVKYLIEAEADPNSANLNNETVLHKCFQTGIVPLILLVQGVLTDRGISLLDVSVQKEGFPPCPLALGISTGKMTVAQLVECADPSARSISVFIHNCPRAVGPFLYRLSKTAQQTDITDNESKLASAASDFIESLTRHDVAQALRDSVDASSDLINYVTATPDVEDRGWHPLPSRVSFAPRTIPHRLWNFFNGNNMMMTFYQMDRVWTFDSRDFTSPPWHKMLIDRSPGNPIVDAQVRVCHVPDLLTAECFSALCSALEDDNNLEILQHEVLNGLVMHAFENYSVNVELSSFFLSCCALGGLLFQDWFSNTAGDLRDEMLDVTTAHLPAVSFVAARGVVDMMLEVFEFLGLCSIHRWRDYFRLGNLIDVAIACVPAYLFIDPSSRPAMMITIGLCWSRLFGITSCAELIGQPVQPFRNLASGLGPALYVTGMAFGTFMHLFYNLKGGSVQDIGYESFTTLITAGIPDKPSEDMLETTVLYFAVSFFTVFILNIFIGVIGEQYEKEADRRVLSFMRMRANLCLRFVLRIRVMPCLACPVLVSRCIALGSIATGICVQVYSYTHLGCVRSFVVHEGVAYLICQSLLMLTAFQIQDNDVRDAIRGKDTKESRHYLWICKELSYSAESDLVSRLESKIESCFGSLREEMLQILRQFPCTPVQ